ncbi:SLOG family protein [Agathobaculum sp. Marseille-P7918]|uniref:SLOG family protein n=1 Tax=Agathobaculum sp. Marseille-P7918 TaxID=2479843 RepID=UPI000F64020E|nr:SLOG family protein [Agathobaculum sp. Marseille-P7918]
MNRLHACCFTGHRDIPPEILPTLAAKLEAIVLELIADGIRYFYAGGALGFDTLAAETVLQLRDQFPQIRLILAIPCREQTRGWSTTSINRYGHILHRANEVIYTSEHYTRGCMQRRNRFMVDHSAVCVAYCTRSTGGSAYTPQYARKFGLRILLLNM